ncbi:hypothetical protein ACFYPW_26155 [Micromonospora zamorensis]|uniref:hypothetical protein n=1 Tax=Micromonospora zamorensis TaxID=709883 RepID=UPI0036790D67
MAGETSLLDQPVDVVVGDYQNAGDVVTVPSPLPYIFAEEKQADQQAREALFCTFNADLGFFERAVLGVTQSTGARVTVVGDLRMSNPDPRAARNAGTRYIHGLAATPTGSAFHPKLTVIVGPARALVAVGSGNLSVGGWHLNAETWTIAAADRDRCPQLVLDAADWLRSVARLCAISPPAADAMGRTATALEAFNDGQVVDTGHRLVHTSEAPIIDQLPATPVECLRLYAPFHDERAEAIQELLLRLTPARVTLAVQSGHRTVVQPEAIARVIDDLGIDLEVVQDRHCSYRHGKLVEAIGDDGACWTLTGSPNLSSVALLKSVADGGNVELGVLAQPSASLFPGGVPIRLDEVPAVRISATKHVDKATGATLLAATRAADGLHVTFVRPTPCSARVEASAHTDFDTWADVGAVPEGAVHHFIAGIDLPGGSRVRTVWTEHGVTRDGNLVFVTDPARTMLRLGDEPRERAQGPIELLADARLAERWLHGVRQLAAARASIALPAVGGTGGPAGESDASTGTPKLDTDPEDWLRYSDDAKSRLGAAMFHFSLGGFAALSAATTTYGSDLLQPTDLLSDERAAGLDEDDANTVNDDIDPSTGENAEADSPGSAHGESDPDDDTGERALRELRRIGNALTRTVRNDLAHLPAVDRLAVGTLVLVGVELGAWETPYGERGWISVLARVVETLDLDDIPPAIEANVASVAAVALYLIRDHLPTTGRPAEYLRYEAAAHRAAHLVVAADAILVADHAEAISNSRGFPIDPDDVMRTVAMIVDDDPIATAIDVLEDRRPAWRVSRHADAALHVGGTFTNPFPAAAEALDAIDGADVAAVWATSANGRWAIAARAADDLMRVEQRDGAVQWWHYRVTVLGDAIRIARDNEFASRVRIHHGPLNSPFPEALTLLANAGIDVAAGPPE